MAALAVLAPAGQRASAAPYVLNDLSDTFSADVTTDGVEIGNTDAVQSFVTVNENVHWNNFGDLHVGRNVTYHPAEVTYDGIYLKAGATLTSTGETIFGFGTNKRAVVQIDDGASLSGDGVFQLGTSTARYGSATHNITNQLLLYGSLTTGKNSLVGIGKGAVANVDLQGMNAVWNNTNSLSGTLDLGSSGGYGEMNVTDGGTLNTTWLMVGSGKDFSDNTTPADGHLHIEGSDYLGVDSHANIGSYLSIGEYGGTGEVTVDNRGKLDVSGRIILGMDGGTGTLTLNANSQATVGFKLDSYAGSTVDLTAGGKMLVGSGDVDSLPAGTLKVGFGGTLAGTGTIKANVVGEGATLSPGHSPGTLTIDGDLTLDPSSVLTMEIGGTDPGQFDQLNVLGSASLGGQLSIVFLNGFAPTDGTSLDMTLFSATSSLVTSFNSISVDGLDPSLTLDFDPGELANGHLSAVVTAVPEPASAGLLLLAAAGMLPLRRRHA
jgi:hypothetical protein